MPKLDFQLLPDLSRHEKLAIADQYRISHLHHLDLPGYKRYRKQHLYPITTPIHFLNFSDGTTSFFQIEKGLAVMFALCSILAVVSIIGFALLSPFKYSTSIFQYLSYGNFYPAIFETELTDVKYGLLIMIAISECLMSLFLLFGLKCIKRSIKSKSGTSLGYTASASNYSIVVEGIPKDLKDASLIANHFRCLAPVHSVLLVYDVKEWASNQKDIDKCIEFIVSDQKAKNPTIKSLSYFQLYHMTENDRIINGVEELVRLLLSPDESKKHCFKTTRLSFLNKLSNTLKARAEFSNPVQHDTTGFAFVTFRHSWAVDRVLSVYEESYTRNCLDIPNGQIKELSIGGNVIHVSRAPDPSDVLFENIGITQKAKAVRTFFITLYSLIAIIIGIVIIIVIKRSTLQYSSDFFLTALIAIVNSIVKYIIRMIVSSGGRISGALSQSATHSGQSFRQFLGTFSLNFLVVIFLTVLMPNQAYVDGKRIQHFTGSYFLSFHWYEQTVSTIYMNIILDSVLDFVFELLHPVDRLLNFPTWFAADKKDQPELNFSRTPSPWPVAERMSSLMYLFMIGCIFSHIMPLAIPTLAVFFFLQYWVDKTAILRWYRDPPPLSLDMLKNFVRVIEVGIFFRLVLVPTLDFAMLAQDKDKVNTTGFVSAIITTAFTVVVFVYYIIRRMCRTTSQKGRDYKHKKLIEYKRMHDDGVTFDQLQERVEHFVDNHPLYTHSVHLRSLSAECPLLKKYSITTGTPAGHPNEALNLSQPISDLASANTETFNRNSATLLDLLPYETVRGMLLSFLVQFIPKETNDAELSANPPLENGNQYYSFWCHSMPYFRRKEKKRKNLFLDENEMKQLGTDIKIDGEELRLVDLDSFSNSRVSSASELKEAEMRRRSSVTSLGSTDDLLERNEEEDEAETPKKEKKGKKKPKAEEEEEMESEDSEHKRQKASKPEKKGKKKKKGEKEKNKKKDQPRQTRPKKGTFGKVEKGKKQKGKKPANKRTPDSDSSDADSNAESVFGDDSSRYSESSASDEETQANDYAKLKLAGGMADEREFEDVENNEIARRAAEVLAVKVAQREEFYDEDCAELVEKEKAKGVQLIKDAQQVRNRMQYLRKQQELKEQRKRRKWMLKRRQTRKKSEKMLRSVLVYISGELRKEQDKLPADADSDDEAETEDYM
ncbi:putative calcium permeable stress-gated cation channel [Blattamonas nauphoetae]|uniref:Calcium permeable stress-gated cation channel n=1 Tax=Blattamonas nauphoetae TaxID=2049346 RepID=A0ABQ9XXF6_9EUKA|nr:putative calcium permeable stress-gated cation channel [Blattamonas nauphoetae]